MLAVMRHMEHVRVVLDAVPVLMIPLWQVLLFCVIIAIAAAMERNRMCLIVTYVFSAYWVFVENLKKLAMDQVSAVTVLIFLALGITILVLYIYHVGGSGGKSSTG